MMVSMKLNRRGKSVLGGRLRAMNVEELMGLEFDEGGEREYRRGIWTGCW